MVYRLLSFTSTSFPCLLFLLTFFLCTFLSLRIPGFMNHRSASHFVYAFLLVNTGSSNSLRKSKGQANFLRPCMSDAVLITLIFDWGFDWIWEFYIFSQDDFLQNSEDIATFFPPPSYQSRFWEVWRNYDF